jgi:hypothetical protein
MQLSYLPSRKKGCECDVGHACSVAHIETDQEFIDRLELIERESK